jgi:hypothetical protein
MEPHNPENSRHDLGTGAEWRRSALAFWLTIALIAFVVAIMATLVSYL